MDSLCQGCGAIIPAQTLNYRLRLELFAAPEIPTFTREDLEQDLKTKWHDLIHTLEQMSEEEVAEAEDQVYESYEFMLCPACRRLWHTRLREIIRQFTPGPEPPQSLK